MNKQQYATAEQDFIVDWANRWRQLINLIYALLRTDRPITLSILVETDEVYQNLRSWFLDNKVPFLALWKDFYESRDWDWVLDTSNDLITEIRGAEQTLEPLFFRLYGFKDLNTLFRECVIDNETGKISDQKTRISTKATLTLDSIASDFVCWVILR